MSKLISHQYHVSHADGPGTDVWFLGDVFAADVEEAKAKAAERWPHWVGAMFVRKVGEPRAIEANTVTSPPPAVPTCDCELRARQWDGTGKCLTCGRRYRDRPATTAPAGGPTPEAGAADPLAESLQHVTIPLVTARTTGQREVAEAEFCEWWVDAGLQLVLDRLTVLRPTPETWAVSGGELARGTAKWDCKRGVLVVDFGIDTGRNGTGEDNRLRAVGEKAFSRPVEVSVYPARSAPPPSAWTPVGDGPGGVPANPFVPVTLVKKFLPPVGEYVQWFLKDEIRTRFGAATTPPAVIARRHDNDSTDVVGGGSSYLMSWFTHWQRIQPPPAPAAAPERSDHVQG